MAKRAGSRKRQGVRLSLANALEIAVGHQKAGEFDKAGGIYRQILRRHPDNADALHLLGVLSHQAGEPERAVELIKRAIAGAPPNEAFHNNLGEVYRATGRLKEAVAEYRRALDLNPDSHETQNNLGATFRQMGKVDEAVAQFRRALELKPDYAEPYLNLGSLEIDRRNFEAAEGHLERALALAPGRPDALHNMVLLRRDQGRLEEAMAVCERLIERDPNFYKAYNELADLHRRLGNVAEAERWFRTALERKPDYAEAYNNLGGLLGQLGHYEEALKHLKKAVALRHGYADAYYNLGNTYRELRRTADAIKSYRRAIALDHRQMAAHNNLGMTLCYQGRTAAALEAFRKAMKIRPHDAIRIKAALVLPVIHPSHESMARARADLDKRLDRLADSPLSISEPITDVGTLVFHLAYMGDNDRPFHEKLARIFLKACPARRFTAAHCARPPAPPEGRRVRVGFLSRFFRQHTIGLLYKGVIANLPRDRFHVTAITFNVALDRAWQEIRASADDAVLLPMRLDEMRSRIAEKELDVLVWADIGMEAGGYFLAYSRLAPVQCVSWGHPVTTGIPTMDYFVSGAELEVEGTDDHYSERLVRLALPPTYYFRPNLTGVPAARDDYGLGADTNLYLCPQSGFKFHPDVDRVFGEILRRDPNGEIAIVNGGDPHWISLLRGRFARTMPDVAARISVVERQPRERFITLMSLADVMLDTPHFSGGNTSFEALSIGTPIVTMPSGFMRGRVTHALYRQMGFDDCVAASADEYVEIAVRLGTDAGYRAQVSAAIRARNAVLFENRRVIEEWARFLESAVSEAAGTAATGA